MHRRTGWPAGVAGRFRRSGLVGSVTRGNEGAIFPAFDAGQATDADTPYVQTNFSYVVPAAVLGPNIGVVGSALHWEYFFACRALVFEGPC
jgi:hypothetical protein